ncbi:hypothetical protein GIY23_03610 [Allosaccharopolyspora coralli]|uniref:TNase-like domain-containing protein n=1 Tax=Allosaccharopolyspora coralli TaxID=2665642 RepID=A0A5Q3Q5J0_9PSEU|nr:thermonuclease family protein [Allosaccharopolyspora coralli]QGK68756.1 hypothetical protein GIY23_03610 [Allosaccharopolyspora coralli]
MSRTFAHPALVGTGMLLACVAASCRAEPVEQSTPPPPETVTVTAGAPNLPSAASTPPTTPRTESPTRLLDNSVTIAEVVDGDTVRYSVGPRSVTARLLGIDAPEAGTCAGTEATDWAMSTLLGNTVRVHYDDSQQPSDRYGRELVYLTLPNGRDYSTETAREGHAEYFDVGVPVVKASAIQSAVTQARNAERGLWGPPCLDEASAPAAPGMPPVPPPSSDEPTTRTTETTTEPPTTGPPTTGPTTTGPATSETTTETTTTEPTTTDTTTTAPFATTSSPAFPEATTP